jgi:enolase
MDGESMLEYLCDLVTRFPIWSIEDPFHVDDVHHWQKLRKLFSNLQVVGDDIFAGSYDLIREGVACGAANGFILKPDFSRSVSEITRVIKVAIESKVSVIVSHRSGDNCDSFVADLAAALDPTGAFGVGLRAGGTYCGERVAKWNRLMEIEDEVEFKVPLSFYVDDVTPG